MTIDSKLQELFMQLKCLNSEIKSPADERIQNVLEIVYELLGILAEDKADKFSQGR